MPSLRRILSSAFALSLYSSAGLSGNAESFVMCPALDTIRQAAPLISTAEIDNQNTYTAATDKLVFRDNKLIWGIAINHVVANSTKEAVANAQALVPKITVMWSETALHYGVMYACIYFLASSSFDQVAMVLGAKERGEKQLPTFFPVTNTTQAKDTVKCPSVDKIRQASFLITEAEYGKLDKLYAASSKGSAIVENGVEWKLGSLYIRATSIGDAITIGQDRTAKATQVLYQSASIRDSTYLCLYYDGTLQNPYLSVMATAKVNTQWNGLGLGLKIRVKAR